MSHGLLVWQTKVIEFKSIRIVFEPLFLYLCIILHQRKLCMGYRPIKYPRDKKNMVTSFNCTKPDEKEEKNSRFFYKYNA